MHLFILCIGMILAKDYVLADTPVSCETDDIQNDTMRLEIRFRIEGIIPELIPSPAESVLRVIWQTAEADIGNCINQLETVFEPCYSSSNIDEAYNYTVIIINNDFPSSVVGGKYLNALNVNINATNNEIFCTPNGLVAPYIPPTPATCSGSRMYCVFLYEQQEYIDINDVELLRQGAYPDQFNLTDFLANYPIGPLRAANYWVADDCCGVYFDTCCNCNNNNGCNANNNGYSSNSNGCNSNSNGCNSNNNGCNSNDNGCNTNNNCC